MAIELDTFEQYTAALGRWLTSGTEELTCEEHGEFACNSKACAPPPVGTGGSISTGIGSLARSALKGGVAALYAAKGFNAKPQVVSDTQFDHLIRQGKVRESWRGISLAGSERSVPESVSRAYERADEHPVIEGTFGSGTYVAFGKNGEREARQYAGKGGAVLRIGIPPKMGSEPVLRQVTEVVDRLARGGEGVKAFEPRNIAQGARLYQSLRDAGIDDDGVRRLARDAAVIGMLLGWDGVYVSDGAGESVGYALVWNRGATVVSPDVLTASVTIGFVDGALVAACEEHGEFGCDSKACAPPPVGTGGSLPSGSSKASRSGTSLPLGANTTRYAKEVVKKRESDTRSSIRTSPYEHSQVWLNTFPDDPVVRIRVPASVVSEILNSGRLKTQHETRTSKGLFNPGLRDSREKAMFSMKESPRLVYGYLAQSETEQPLAGHKSVKSHPLEPYGDAIIELKRSVLGRVTVSLGDSLHFRTTELAPLRLQEVGKLLKKIESPEDLYSPERSAAYQRLWAATEVDSREYPYYEAQVHGGVTVDDIERIYLTEDAQINTSVSDLALQFPDVEFVGLDSPIHSMFSLLGDRCDFKCTEHGEFACNSKACAPPPIGTGGSLPSGGLSSISKAIKGDQNLAVLRASAGGDPRTMTVTTETMRSVIRVGRMAREAILGRLASMDDDSVVIPRKIDTLTSKGKEKVREITTKHEKSVRDTYKKEIIASLNEVRRFGGKAEVEMYDENVPMRSVLNELREGLKGLPSAWINTSNKAGDIVVLRDGRRAMYEPDSVNLTLNNDPDAARHEMTHRMEYVVSGIRALEAAFYEMRASGNMVKLNSLMPSKGYADSEITDPDEYWDSYVGKDYKGQAYEIMSMGTQYVFEHLARIEQLRRKVAKAGHTGSEFDRQLASSRRVANVMDDEFIDFVFGTMLTVGWEE